MMSVTTNNPGSRATLSICATAEDTAINTREAVIAIRRRRRHRGLVVTVTAAIAMALGCLGIATPSASASPTSSGCGASEYVSSVDIYQPSEWGPDFKVVVTPTNYGRTAGAAAATDRTLLRPIVVSMWHSVQDCVPGLYGSLADSIWQQLECHEMFPLTTTVLGKTIGGGPTYDLESYRLPLEDSEPTVAAYVYSHCLNLQWHDGPENGTPGYGNNQPGYLDSLEVTRHTA